MADTELHRWDLALHGVHHRVQISGSFSRTITWHVDDKLVATRKSSDDTVRLSPDESPDADDSAGLGAIGVKFSGLGRPQRVTWYGGQGDISATAQSLLGTGGIDLDPEPGSPAALRDERIRQHPRRYAALAVAGGVAKVVVPVLLSLIAVRFAISIPWPDWNLPRIPWPHVDLPSIPWPDLPSIPWPDIHLPDWQLPDWVRWVLDKVKFVWPVILAWAVARAEINRRRKQDALKAELRAATQPEAVPTEVDRPSTARGAARPDQDDDEGPSPVAR